MHRHRLTATGAYLLPVVAAGCLIAAYYAIRVIGVAALLGGLALCLWALGGGV